MAFTIWSICACIFLFIAWYCRRATQPVGFFTGNKPPQVKDTAAYNRAMAKLWLVFACLLELIGIPLLFIGQNDPLVLLPLLAVPMLVIGLMVAYFLIENKYKA